MFKLNFKGKAKKCSTWHFDVNISTNKLRPKHFQYFFYLGVMVTVSQRKRPWQEAICWEILWGRILSSNISKYSPQDLQNIISSNISKYYLQIFFSRFAKYYQLKYLQILSSNILFKICKILSAQISLRQISLNWI